MSMIGVDYGVLNQKGSPSWFSDIYANIPTAGYKGRMFISIDTYAFYRDTGTGWDLIGGPGTGTITGSGTSGQVSYFNGSSTLAGSNNLFWDNTNSRLGINTTTPGVPLDIHATGTNAQFNGTGTNNAYLAFQNAGTSKWRIGNTYNAGANSFDIYNVGTSANALSFGFTTNVATFTKDILINSLTIGNGGGAIATNTAIGSGALAVNTTGFQNIAIGTNSLSLNSTGLSNIAIGHRSLENSIGGGGNVAVGVFSLNNVTTGQSNVSIGINAGLGLTTGLNNIFIGSGSATGITTGSNNTIIGNYAGTTALANNIVLADGAGNVKYQWDGTNNLFTGNVNFSSTIGNGTYTYTLPSASGTLALTSQIPANIVTGTGTSGQVAYWNGTATQTGTNNFFWDNTNTRLGINTNTPLNALQVVSALGTIMRIGEASGTTGKQLLFGIDSTTGRSEIQSVWQGTANTPLGLNVAGGNVLVGITSDNGALFQVNGSTTIGGSTTITAGNSYSNYALKINNSAGAEKLRLDGNGNLLIGYTTDQGYKFGVNGTSLFAGAAIFSSNVGIGVGNSSVTRLLVQGDTSSSNYAFIATDSSATNLFFVRNDGYMYFGLAANSPYNIAQAGRSCILASNGSVGYLVSTRESKANIESIKNVDFINELNPVQFNYRKRDNDLNYTDELYDNITYGFIADEVEKVNKELAFYNADGTLAGVEYNSMIAILTKAIQELNDKLVRNNIN